MTRIRKSAEERKSEIVETALRLADKGGPDRLSTEAIARAIRVTQAAIFRHFPTKQDLWEAVAMRIREKFQRQWRLAESSESSAPGKIRLLIAAQLKLIQSTPAIPAILFSRELHTENEHLRELVYGTMKRFHEVVADLIELGKQSGHFGQKLDSHDAAYLVIALLQGLVLRWSLGGRKFDLENEGVRLLSTLLDSFGSWPAEARANTEKR